MKKLKLVKAQFYENTDSVQLSLTWDTEKVKKETGRFRINQILSDTPPGSTRDDYPYHVVSGGVMLHPVFKSLFPEGDVPVMSKEEADRLCASEFGFDKKSGCACRITTGDEEIEIVVYPPNDTPYLMDCFTGLKKEDLK